jgi:hypothetical protein
MPLPAATQHCRSRRRATLSKQEKGSRQMSRRVRYMLPASSARRQGAPRGDVPPKSWGFGRGLAAQAHVLASVAPPVLAAYSLGVASGVDAPLLSCSHVLHCGAQAGAGGDAALSQAGEEHSADEKKSRVNITRFICTEKRRPSRRRTFKESETWPQLGGTDDADLRFSSCCATCACCTKPRRGLRHRRYVINMFVWWHVFFESTEVVANFHQSHVQNGGFTTTPR